MKKILAFLSLFALLATSSPVTAAPHGPDGVGVRIHAGPPPQRYVHHRAGWNVPPPPPPKYYTGNKIIIGGVLNGTNGYWNYNFCSNPFNCPGYPYCHNYPYCNPCLPNHAGYNAGIYLRF